MKMLNRTEAAKLLRCNPDRLGELAARGEIPGTKVGKSWIFIEDELYAYLREKVARETQKRRAAAEVGAAPSLPVPGRRRGRPRLPVG